MYVVTLSVFHNLAIWLLYVNKPEPEPVPEVTCDSHTDFKVKRSKVKVTGRGHIVAAT